MLSLRLSDIADWTNGRLFGADATICSVSTDTRSLQAGELFVALVGENFDAHDFVPTAQQRGAAAVLVARWQQTDLPQIVVADTLLALGDLAKEVRRCSHARVVGITGSNGKTTVKTLTASILKLAGSTHVNAGNFNNEIGLPLTLLQMPTDCQYAVIEMGAGKPGDIQYLAAIAQPYVGLVNNIAAAHLERMGSEQGVAETKGALYAALPADGIAIINDDDPFAGMFTMLAQGRRQLRFGLGANADIGARALELGTHSLFTLRTPTGDAEVKLPLPGRHNVHNALAAAAIAYALDVSLGTIVRGLERVEPVKGRLVRHERAGWTLIDDSYNANPGSTAAAIATLVLEAGEPWLVLGDMKELGAQAQQLHAQIGALAKRSGVVRLLTVGELSGEASEAFGIGARHFSDQESLAKTLIAELRPGVRCLIKGSRSSAMERVVQAVLDQQAGNGGGRHAA